MHKKFFLQVYESRFKILQINILKKYSIDKKFSILHFHIYLNTNAFVFFAYITHIINEIPKIDYNHKTVSAPTLIYFIVSLQAKMGEIL